MRKFSKLKGFIFIMIFVATIYAGASLMGESVASGEYSYSARYKSGVKFVTSSRSSSTMGYFTLKKAADNSYITLFCGAYGKSVYSNTYTRYNFNKYFSFQTEDWRTKVESILLLYTPNLDESNLNALKSYLSTNYPTQYASAGLSNLTVKETIATFQAALWHFTNDQNWAYYKAGDVYNRTMMLYNILLQSTYGNLVNINYYTENISFDVKSALAWSDTSLVTTIGPVSGVNFDYTNDTYSIVFKTNKGTTISSSNYTSSYDSNNNSQIYTFTGITQDADNNLVYNGETFDTIMAVVTASSSTLSGKKAYVYAPDSSGNYQIYFGAETSSVTSKQDLSLTAPSVQSLSIRFNKVDIDNLSGSNLSGAYLKLYRLEGENRVLIKEWASGQAYYEISGLVAGTYIIDETITPLGYQKYLNYSNLNAETNSLYISSDKSFTLDNTITNVDVVNSKTKINILKQDLENNNISGAKFNIIDQHGDIYYSFTSTSTAISIEGVLETGVYFLEEVEAPTNYALSNVLYRFNLGYDGTLPTMDADADEKYASMTIQDVTFGANNLITLTNRPGLSVSKKDFANNTLYVNGATLTITNRSTSTVVTSWVTTSEDHLIFLDDGNYTLTETITPNGYATAESIDFTVTNGKVINDVSLNMKDKRLNVCIAKKSTNVASNLAGAVFEVYNSDNVLVASFTSEMDEYCFNDNTNVALTNTNIKPGMYTVKEISAPSGYKIKNQYTQIEILNTGELQLFEIYNDVGVSKTDLSVSQIVYIMAIVMGTCGIGLVLYYVKKYRY